MHVIFANVEKFRGIRTQVRVSLFDCSCLFVAEEGDTFDKSVLVFLLEGVIEGVIRELEQVLRFLDQRLTERCGGEVEIEEAMGTASFKSRSTF